MNFLREIKDMITGRSDQELKDLRLFITSYIDDEIRNRFRMSEYQLHSEVIGATKDNIYRIKIVDNHLDTIEERLKEIKELLNKIKEEDRRYKEKVKDGKESK